MLYNLCWWGSGIQYCFKPDGTLVELIKGVGYLTLEQATELRRKNIHTAIYGQDGSFKSEHNPIL